MTHAGDGAAGAHAGNENIHFAVRICPDFRAGGSLMGGGVGGIYKLAGDKAVGDFFCQLLGFGNGAGHALAALGQHQLGTVGFHQLTALHAHGFRHDDDDAVAAGGGNGGKTDAGIAGGGLDDHGAGFQQTFFLGIVNHGFCHTVFHRAGGVEIFQFCQNLGVQMFILLQMHQLQQGSVSNQLVGRGVNTAHDNSS